MNTTFKSPLSGIIPPLVTPLLGNDTLDVASLEILSNISLQVVSTVSSSLALQERNRALATVSAKR